MSRNRGEASSEAARYLSRMRTLWKTLPVMVALAGCGRGAGTPACGIAWLAGPVMILDQFSVPRQTLSAPPSRMPETLAVRVAVGPALRGLVGRADSLLVIGMDEPWPATVQPGFGVLITTLEGAVSGVVLFEGEPIAGAPLLGQIHADTVTIPLIGLRVDPRLIQDPRCPLFPEPDER